MEPAIIIYGGFTPLASLALNKRGTCGAHSSRRPNPPYHRGQVGRTLALPKYIGTMRQQVPGSAREDRTEPTLPLFIIYCLLIEVGPVTGGFAVGLGVGVRVGVADGFSVAVGFVELLYEPNNA